MSNSECNHIWVYPPSGDLSWRQCKKCSDSWFSINGKEIRGYLNPEDKDNYYRSTWLINSPYRKNTADIKEWKTIDELEETEEIKNLKLKQKM